jgi:hypothetical protein
MRGRREKESCSGHHASRRDYYVIIGKRRNYPKIRFLGISKEEKYY